MFKKRYYRIIFGLSLSVLLLSACSGGIGNVSSNLDKPIDAVHAETEVIEPHKDLNQEPVPLEMERDGTDVYIKMTTQITDIEIEPGNMYKAWTFNGEAPGPLIVVEEGDTLHFEVDNIDPAVPHSIDLHAVHTHP